MVFGQSHRARVSAGATKALALSRGQPAMALERSLVVERVTHNQAVLVGAVGVGGAVG
ncbi:hypothetical protein D3C76_1811910 [compost metagenome]